MGTIRINQLPESTGITSDDLLIIMDNPNTNQLTKKITIDNLRNSILNQPATLQFRQGLDSERLFITPANAEPIWTTDTKKLYIGDGSTVGGLFINNSPIIEGSGASIATNINVVSGVANSICGGSGNSILSTSSYSTINGGTNNSISSLNSVISAGSSNTINANASHSAIVAGQSNTIANGRSYSLIGAGNLNSISSSYGIIAGGYGNSIPLNANYGPFIGAGAFNIASGDGSSIIGGIYAKTTRYGEVAHANGQFANAGDAQHSTFILRRSTSDATANVVLTANNLNPSTSSRNFIILPDKTTINFSIQISAYNDTDSAGAVWNFVGGIRRGVGANTTTIIGTPTETNWKEAAMTSAVAAVAADTTNGALELRVTGLASKAIRWVAMVDISSCSYGAT